MTTNLDELLSALQLMSAWEITAALLGLGYILLITKESLWGWLFGFASTLIYTVLFWEGALVSSSLLNFYYMFMSGYGYYSWKMHSKESDNQPLKISSYPLKKHLLFITIALFASAILGHFSSTYTDAKSAYLDAFVLSFSILATWMVTQKILENWLYWIVIDSVAIVLYYQNGYLATVLLFTLYIILGVNGYRTWRREFNAY